MASLLWHELRSRRGAVLGWGIGLALFGALYISLWPQMGVQMSVFTELQDLAVYKAMGIEMNSFEGFMASSVVQFMPILAGVFAIIASTGTLAGEEDDGTLELVLAMPLHRWQIVTVKAIALAVVTLVIMLIAGASNALVLSWVTTQTEVSTSLVDIFVATVSGWPLTVAWCMVGLFLGAYLPHRRTAALVLTVVFVASYFGENMAGLVESLEPVKPLSLFSYSDASSTIFTEGIKAGDVGVLLAVAAVFFGLALLSFQRRNVTVGAWPWRRAQVP